MASPVISSQMSASDDEKKRAAANGKRKRESRTSNEGFGVNLMPAELKPVIGGPTKTLTHRFIVSVVWAFVLAGAVYAGIWIYGYYLTQGKLAPVISEKKTVANEITTLETQRSQFLAFQSKLSNAKTLLDKHKYWSQFLDDLEKLTITDVSYVNVISSQDGSVSFSGFARDYKAVGRQLLAFQKATDSIASASISSASAVLNPNGEVTGVNFSLALKVKPEILNKRTAGGMLVPPTETLPTTTQPLQ